MGRSNEARGGGEVGWSGVGCAGKTGDGGGRWRWDRQDSGERTLDQEE